MFNFFEKRQKEGIGCPVKGKTVSIKEVSDPTFADEILGKGVAIIPEEGQIHAPADGKVEMLFDTLHALSMTTDTGAELLIHVGLDTVQLKGEHFEGHVQAGDKVKKGDLLLSVNLDGVRAAGYDVITPIVICNSDNYSSIEALSGKEVSIGEDILLLKKR